MSAESKFFVVYVNPENNEERFIEYASEEEMNDVDNEQGVEWLKSSGCLLLAFEYSKGVFTLLGDYGCPETQ